jgi:hypothetical protein
LRVVMLDNAIDEFLDVVVQPGITGDWPGFC